MTDEIENSKEMRIRDYLAGEADEREFHDWLAGDAEARELFRERVRQYYRIRWTGNWERINVEKASELTLRRVRRFRLRVLFARYAAAILVVLASGLAVWQWQHPETGETPEVASIPVLAGNDPVLTLGDGEQVLVSPQYLKRVRSTDGVDIQLTDSGRLAYVPRENPGVREVSYNTLTVPRGCEFRLTLADGSRVWMNAGSSLKYPEVFPSGKREVYLHGEAYFEVMPDKSAPFVVNTEKMNLQVLGTSFNIKAYDDETTVVTTLITGKVAQTYPEVGKRIELTPSRQSVFDRISGKLETREADVREVLAWKEGKIIANDERLEDIFRQLSRWYDFDVVYIQPSLKDVRFYLHTTRYAEIQSILDHLQTTKGIHFSCKGKVIYVSQ